MESVACYKTKRQKFRTNLRTVKTLSEENIQLIAVEHKKIVQNFVGIISID